MDNLGCEDLESKLDEAVQEAIDDDTFRKVQRVSYQTHGLDDVSIHLILIKNNVINKVLRLV